MSADDGDVEVAETTTEKKGGGAGKKLQTGAACIAVHVLVVAICAFNFRHGNRKPAEQSWLGVRVTVPCSCTRALAFQLSPLPLSERCAVINCREEEGSWFQNNLRR